MGIRCEIGPDGRFLKRHGHTNEHWKSPTYMSWRSMKARCRNKERENAEHYVLKGITYDPRWEDFEAFLADMGERPDGKTLNRIDNAKGYGKDNCNWATPTEQTRNRSIAKYVEWDGQRRLLAEWAEARGIKYGTMLARVKRFGPIAVSMPL